MSIQAPSQGIAVISPSGGTFYVLTLDEEAYYNDRASRYMTDGRYTFVSDLQVVDQILITELFIWRWGLWISMDEDYFGDPIERDKLQASLNNYLKEVRQLKKSIGMDKTSREAARGDNISEYWDDLRRRAKEFGVMREDQLTKALTLFMELDALVTKHENYNERERHEYELTMEDVFKWIKEVAIPEFKEIDNHFRANQQRFWVGDM